MLLRSRWTLDASRYLVSIFLNRSSLGVQLTEVPQILGQSASR